MTALILTSGRQFKSADELLDYADELEETNLQLRQDLGLVKSSETLSRLKARWRLTGREADIVQFLYGRGGMIASKTQILHAMYAITDEVPDIKIVDVYICKIRQKLGAEAIITEWARGYRLAAAALQQIGQVLGTPLAEVERAPNVPAARPKRDNFQGRGLAVFAEHGDLTISQLAEQLPGTSYGQATSVVDTLLRHQRIRHACFARNARGRLCNVYAMTDVGRAYLRKNAAEL